jgi:hypothetical protein
MIAARRRRLFDRRGLILLRAARLGRRCVPMLELLVTLPLLCRVNLRLAWFCVRQITSANRRVKHRF